jgi:hypothetical protein
MAMEPDRKGQVALVVQGRVDQQGTGNEYCQQAIDINIIKKGETMKRVKHIISVQEESQ